ncbi:hypothetical protein LUZ60_015014 [Juncus effusus]|nr:hypothetical protein LUZ60_015014 [Juncus effusus]
MATIKSAPNLLSIHRHIHYSVRTYSTRLKDSSFSNPIQFPVLMGTNNSTKTSFSWRIASYASGEGNYAKDLPGQLSFDAILSMAEIVCILPPAICSIGCLMGLFLPNIPKQLQIFHGNKLLISQYFLLVLAVVISSLIRWRQWQRLYRVNSRGVGVDLIGRVEKVEEDLKSSTTVIRMLSRQLEKLGIRFRVTRKTLKDPISEAAALAQKNSEVTRALAAQNDLLQNELCEIQNLLIAMQEQQQKQLQLILAIGKVGRVIDYSAPVKKENKTGDDSSPVREELEMKSESAVGVNNNKV